MRSFEAVSGPKVDRWLARTWSRHEGLGKNHPKGVLKGGRFTAEA